MQDQAGFDGFAEADFIGQQHARRVTLCDFGGDINLMRQQAGARTEQACDRRALLAIEMREGFDAQLICGEAVGLAAGEALQRRGEFHVRRQLQFRRDVFVAVGIDPAVNQQAAQFVDGGDGQFEIIAHADDFAFTIGDAAERRALRRIGAILTDSGEMQRYAAGINGGNDAQTKFRVGMAEPALANNEIHELRGF
ncbi:conserved hypothetical protein [Ricinus communis]|uniref:Uncharacterized protein n=1 Tax=Ricinus communis TaxID=3988 RepID=B9TQ54_RICCO|nr:conserved hypothetical protein [Ricinus communis]